MKTRIATVLFVLMFSAFAPNAEAGGLYEKWDNPADANIRGELNRAILNEKIENGFFENRPNNYTTIYDNSTNTTNCQTQGSCQNNSSSTIGNQTSINTENCVGDGTCTAEGVGDQDTNSDVGQDNQGNQSAENRRVQQTGNQGTTSFVND